MQRLIPYLLALLLICGATAQDQERVSASKDEKSAQVDSKQTETKQEETPDKADDSQKAEKAQDSEKADKSTAAEPDTTEMVVEGKGHKTHRDPFRANRTHNPADVQVRGDVSVKKGDSSSDIVIVAGNLNVEGEVNGDIVAIATKAYINGPVHGTVVVVPGPVKFGPNASIDQETVVVGEYSRDPGAKFARGFKPVRVPEIVPLITGAKDFIFDGLFMMRPLPPSVRWVWILHGAMFLVLLAMTLLFPRPVAVGAKAISDRPVVSIFSGFLTAILFIPVLLLLVVTVVGIIAVPFAFAGLVLAALFGKASVMEFIGQQVGRNLRVAIFESPLLALAIGAAILALFYMVPVLGFLIWAVATLLGLGAIMVATASTLNSQPSVPTPVGSPIVPPIQPTPATSFSTPGAAPMTDSPPTTATAAASTAPTPTLLRRVGFWKRFFSEVLDVLLILIPMAIGHVFILPLFPLVLIAYFVTMWTWKGTSVGKICLGLKIVRTDGTPIDFAVALVRSLAACFSFIIGFLGFFWAGWDKEKQSWHDKIAGTVVVQVPKGVSLL